MDESENERRRFSRWFKRQLWEHDWTQTQFARKANMSTTSVNNWAVGNRVPAPENCLLIAEALNVDADEVLAMAGHRPVPSHELPEGDPRRALMAKVKRVKWNADRVAFMTSALDQMIAFDRMQENEAEPAAPPRYPNVSRN